MVTTMPPCMYSGCYRRSRRMHNGLKCFAFWDDHWPAFEQLMASSRDSARFRGSAEDVKGEALRFLLDGMKPALVAKRVGVHRETVYRWRTELGHEPQPRNPLSDEEIQQAKQMIADGVSWRQVSMRLHRSAATLKRALAVKS